MSDHSTEAARLQRAENFLRAQIDVLEADQRRNELERQRVEAERARIDLELTKTRNALAELMCGDAPAAPALLPSPREQEPDEAQAPKKGDFAGLELTDAIYQYLLMHKQMKSIKEIWSALEKAGFRVLSGHPTRAVNEALRKRIHRRGDVFKAGNRWGATENFTANYIRRVTKYHAGRGGRSAEEHGAATSEGIERRRARGLQVGAPRKFDAEMAITVRRLRAQGASIAAVCAEVGISPGLYQMYRHRLRVWKEGTVWPPPEPTKEELALLDLQEAQGQQSHLRVVK